MIQLNRSKRNMKKTFMQKMVGFITMIHRILMPNHARKIARKVMLTPVRHHKDPSHFGIENGQFETSEGVLQGYQMGVGPTLLFVHGWSGAANQFFPLMQRLALHGFRTIAFDQPAHGKSEGTEAHVPRFIRALSEVIFQVQENFGLNGIIAHSVGSSATLEVDPDLLQNVPILLIAPVLNPYEQVRNTVLNSGYDLQLFEQVSQEIEREYKMAFAELTPYKNLEIYLGKTAIVHDKRDKVVPFIHSQTLVKNHPDISLYSTEGFGHSRIINTEPVWDALHHLLGFPKQQEYLEQALAS